MTLTLLFSENYYMLVFLLDPIFLFHNTYMNFKLHYMSTYNTRHLSIIIKIRTIIKHKLFKYSKI